MFVFFRPFVQFAHREQIKGTTQTEMVVESKEQQEEYVRIRNITDQPITIQPEGEPISNLGVDQHDLDVVFISSEP